MPVASKTTRIIVLGGLGFIGTHLSRALLDAGYQVRVFDRLFGSRKGIEDIEGLVEVIEGDIARLEDMSEALKGCAVGIHLAHSTAPGSSMKDPVYDVQTNLVPLVRWLPLLGQTDLRKLIYVSSGGVVYGSPRMIPINEDHPTNPVSSYGITKLAMEKYIALYAEMAGVDYKICRPSNVYGENQHLNIGQGAIGVFLEHGLKGRPIEIWGDGRVVRDYLYIRDLVSAIMDIVNYEGEEHVFNIATGVGLSLNGLIEIIQGQLRLPLKVIYKSGRRFDVSSNILDRSRLQRETGWEPKISITEGIRLVYEWMRRSGA